MPWSIKSLFGGRAKRREAYFTVIFAQLLNDPVELTHLAEAIKNASAEKLASQDFILALGQGLEKLSDTPSAARYSDLGKKFEDMTELDRREEAKVAIWALTLDGLMMDRAEELFAQTGQKIIPPTLALEKANHARLSQSVFDQGMGTPLHFMCGMAETHRANWMKNAPAVQRGVSLTSA